MKNWEQKEIMGKLMMPIWMMIGVLIMSEPVAKMVCWSVAKPQLSVDAEVHGSCCVEPVLLCAT